MTTTRLKDPVRGNLPSVSSFESYALCKLKFQLELLAPVPSPTQWAELGREAHALAHEPDSAPAETSDEAKGIARRLAQLESEELVYLKGEHQITFRGGEQRFWYLESGEVYKGPEIRSDALYSGQPDVYYLLDDPLCTAIIFERKALWGDVAPAVNNWQLAGHAVLISRLYGCKRAIVQVLQPNRQKQHYPAVFDAELLEKAEGRILALLDSIADPLAPANPGPEQCKHCAARLICKAAHGRIDEITQFRKAEVATLQDPELERLVIACDAADQIRKAARAELSKRVHERGADFNDWYLQPTGDKTEITNPAMAYALLRDDFDPEEFVECCSVSLAKLTKRLTEIDSQLTEKEARKYLRGLLLSKSGLLVETPKEKTLKHKPHWRLGN